MRLLIIFLLLSHLVSAQDAGVTYFNQQAPGLTFSTFAPDVITLKDRTEFGSVYSKGGKEFFYGVEINGKAETWYMHREGNGWSKPVQLLVHSEYSFNDPCLSPDEKRLYFISNRPLSGNGAKKDFDIWYVERRTNGWSEPINAGPQINSDKNEYYISFTANDDLYFSSGMNKTEANKDDHDIYRSPNEKGKHGKAERLPDGINTTSYEGDVHVAPDESYLIFCSMRPGGFGRGDLWISFRKGDGSWTEPKNMGETINRQRTEYCPFVTPDGKYLLFTAEDDIRWVDAAIINRFR